MCFSLIKNLSHTYSQVAFSAVFLYCKARRGSRTDKYGDEDKRGSREKQREPCGIGPISGIPLSLVLGVSQGYAFVLDFMASQKFADIAVGEYV